MKNLIYILVGLAVLFAIYWFMKPKAETKTPDPTEGSKSPALDPANAGTTPVIPRVVVVPMQAKYTTDKKPKILAD